MNYNILFKGFGNTIIGGKYSQNLFIPKIKKGKLSDLKVGQNVVFIDEDGKSHFGLQNWINTDLEGIQTYIIDNHNYALYFWYLNWIKNNKPKYVLIHIDQHSDLGIPSLNFQDFLYQNGFNFFGNGSQNENDIIRKYTNEICQVGNFINPGLEIGIISDQLQIRTEYGLLNFQKNDFFQKNDIMNCKFILDIDIDFRDPNMGFENTSKTYKMIRQIIAKLKIDCITIATSPYFIDQNIAIEITKNIFKKSLII